MIIKQRYWLPDSDFTTESEQLANSIRDSISSRISILETHLKYNAPEWKIQVGNYKTTLEADKAMIEIN